MERQNLKEKRTKAITIHFSSILQVFSAVGAIAVLSPKKDTVIDGIALSVSLLCFLGSKRIKDKNMYLFHIRRNNN